MTSAILVGQPNVGKTSFVINFAQYLGVEEVELLVRRSAGFVATETYPVNSALEKLTATTSHTTKKLQSIKLNLPVGKQDKVLKLVDSCGLLAGIHPEKKTREAMSQTLQQVFTSQIVLHMIDVSKSDLEHQLPQIDQELYNFLQDKMEYKILANKIDLDTGQQGLNSLYQLVDQRLVLPISALYQSGFAEVKKFLLNQI